MADHIFEVSPSDVEVEPGKRVTIYVEVPPVGMIEVVLDEAVAAEIVRRWLEPEQ